MGREYTLEELRGNATLFVGQSCNLKVETEDLRVWLSRCTVEDGEPYNNKVTEERKVDGEWQEVGIYPARSVHDPQSCYF